MTKPLGGDVKKNVVASVSKGSEDERINSVFGKYSEAEMIAQLKGLAVDPCDPQFAKNNIQPLWNQILRIRKVMVEDSEIPWRKRKLEQFVKDKLRSPDFIAPNQQNIAKLSRRQLSHASSVSCLLNAVNSTQGHDEKIIFDSRTSCSLLTFDESLPDKHPCTKFSFLDDMVKSASSRVDTDGSVNGSNPLTPENMTPSEVPPTDINNTNCHSNLPKSDGTHTTHPCRSISLPKFIDQIQRKVMPVGPRFQADIPEWTGPVNRRIYNSDMDNTKWLGTRIWPIEHMKNTSRKIGKGKPDSCSCVSRQSTGCIRKHVLEKRLLLQRELGPAFFSWKFDEMGEQVSASWTLKEQQTFESLVKTKPSSNENNFLKRALKCFPKKDRKDIVNYYFSVYIPKRMRSLPSEKQVNTDDEYEDEDKDENENSNDMGLQTKSGGKTIANCKDVKVRFLRG